MAMTFSTNQTGANTDYMRYVSGQISKTDKINAPDLLDFTVINYDGAFVKLARGAHIVLTTATYGVWFAGYIVNDPQLTYLGTAKNVPKWGYVYQASGEEYMLNQKPFGIVAPFINTTQGAILTYLLDLLTPVGINIDTSGIQAGLAVPRFIVDPNKHFTEIVQEFAKAAHYQFRCQNFVATYVQQDLVPSGFSVDANSQHFTPSQLSMQPAGDPIINDSIVLGGIEPQKYMEEFFIGDGATAQFTLASSVFGVDSTLLLQDDMSNSSIDSGKWTVYDPTGTVLLPYGGSVNVIGGANNGSLDVSLQSQSLVPLEGNLRLTHGEWDFIGGSGGNDGVLGSLWTGQTTGSLVGCLFGIRATPIGTGAGAGTLLNPIKKGFTDPTQSVTVDYNRRYIMRTMLSSKEAKRFRPGYASRSSVGVISPIQLTTDPDHFYATTVITEVDPITAIVTNQWTWYTDLGPVLPVSGYYVPVAANNLNLTVQSVTVSVPIQATLNLKANGTTTWLQQWMGPNEVDALDGMAPAATIVDSNSGASTRNSLLGSANYNPGQATLTYFKNTAQLISYLPSIGDLIHLSYRGAGAAMGRAQSQASIALEAAGWKDDGVRSETKSDLKPQPMTSEECQMAAVARVNDNCYQHWSGTYTLPSGSWITAQPLAGTLIRFLNLPSQFPSYLAAETITEVKTTLLSLSPKEQYNHAVTFGPTTSVENVLSSIKSTKDVFTPQDTAEIPRFIDVTALGSTSVPSVPTFNYTSKDANYWYFNFVDPLPASISGIETRYADNGWGADYGNNLLSRLTNTLSVAYSPVAGLPAVSNGFAVPRTVRAAIVYLRCYDQRNKLLNSEDLTQASCWSKSMSSTATRIRMKDKTNNYALVNRLNLTSTGQYYQVAVGNLAASNYGTFTVDLFGTAGNVVDIQVEAEATPFPASVKHVTLTGAWQRVSVTSQTFAAGQAGSFCCIIKNNAGVSQVVYATQASLEIGTPFETMYCKTKTTAYGVTSRFSTGLHTALPLIPPAPTAIGDFSKIEAPVISTRLPANLTNVWGCEIRAADNTTVLFHTDLVNATLSVPTATGDTSMQLSQVCPALSKRSYSYYIYTYNLFGEYSAPFLFTGIISPPTVSNLNVVNETMMVEWTGSNATAYEFYVDKTDMTLTDLAVSAGTINTFYQLKLADFTSLRYIAVTPYDALGPGDTMGGFFWSQGAFTPNALANSSFELGSTGYALGVNWGVGTGHSCFGTQAAFIAGTLTSPLTSASSITNSSHMAVSPGGNFTAQCMIDGSTATGQFDLSSGQPLGYGLVTIAFFNASNVQIGPTYNGNQIVIGGMGWNLSSVTQVAPAGATYAIVGCTVSNQSGGTVFVDDFYANATPITLTVGVPAGQVYFKLGNVGIDHNIHISTALNPQGSILPNQPVPLTYTFGPTTIAVTCPTLTLLRADGSFFAVVGGTITYTGLSQVTCYYLYPYIRVSDGTLQFANPNPPGYSPSDTQALQSQSDGRIGLGALSITTSVAGGTSSVIGIPGISLNDVVYANYTPATVNITIAGNGTGATATMGWSMTNPSPPTFTPRLAITNLGSGYTSATATIHVVSGASPWPDLSTYPCTIGTPGGVTGSGGGGVTCPEADELVELQGKGRVRAGDVVAGDYVKGWSFEGNCELYRRVLQTSSVVCATWRLVDGYRVSPTEPVYWQGSWTLAYRVPGSEFDTVRGYKVKIHVETDDYDEQNYYLVTGENPLLIHNYTVSSC